MKKIVVGTSVLILVALAVGLVLYFRNKGQDEAVAKPARTQTPEMLKERGPRPTDSRLRDGAKQVENPNQALVLARESLVRVEKELAEATNGEERARLQKKKDLVTEAIERFEKNR
jgi:hypothetical protein